MSTTHGRHLVVDTFMPRNPKDKPREGASLVFLGTTVNFHGEVKAAFGSAGGEVGMRLADGIVASEIIAEDTLAAHIERLKKTPSADAERIFGEKHTLPELEAASRHVQARKAALLESHA